MATELKRLTFVVTQELEPRLDHTKKELFYDRTQSEMIRELVLAGLDAMDVKAVKEKDHEKTA